MPTDLFGNEFSTEVLTGNESYIQERDQNLFTLRVERLTYLSKLDPNGVMLSGDAEFVFTYREIQLCYIDGHFLATIVLAQAFVEKLLFAHYEKLGLYEIAEKGLSSILKHARKHNIINEFIIRYVNKIRLKRNPITHITKPSYEHTLSKRSYEFRRSPMVQIELDAKEALEIAVFISMTNLNFVL